MIYINTTQQALSNGYHINYFIFLHTTPQIAKLSEKLLLTQNSTQHSSLAGTKRRKGYTSIELNKLYPMEATSVTLSASILIRKQEHSAKTRFLQKIAPGIFPQLQSKAENNTDQ